MGSTNSITMAETTEQQEVLSWKGFRTLTAWMINKIQAIWASAQASFVNALAQSAWAANNSVNVGMTETAEVLNPMLPQPGTEQIYTTQPAWDFEEGESLQLGSTWTDTSVTPNKVYPIPSLIYDTDGNAHVVFPVWSWLAADGFRFRPMDMPFRHNCNYLGGGLDGFQWDEVSLTSGSSVTVSGDAQTGFTASVPTTATVAVGTWVRLTYTESDASKTAYGYVSAVGEGNVTVTVVGACGTTVTKVELYTPRV